ncbi:hypothetical protein UES1_069 [Escherichia phage UE-S1]|nr:hypothetical protein UES1_069 [Escherichia phage UE-S1]
MSLDLHNELKYFLDLDISELNQHINHITSTVWWSNEHDDPIIQLSDKSSVMRFYKINHKNNIKITYIPYKNILLVETLNPSSLLKITDLDTLQTSESLFQRSLVDDLGGITFEDILQLKKMYSELLEIKNTLVMGY